MLAEPSSLRRAFTLIGFCLLLLLVFPDVGPVLFVLELRIKKTVDVVHLYTYLAWFVIM